jgi:phytoene dehydrogenase-like protein
LETLMARAAEHIVIIGAGHNGLVAALYLAKAGFAPLVLERRSVVGGVAGVEEIHPGFRCPVIAHATGPLLPEVAEAVMAVGERPSALTERPYSLGRGITALDLDGRALRIYEDPQRTAAGLAELSKHDAGIYPEFHACFKRMSAVMAPLISNPPPDIDNLKVQDYLHFGRVGLKFRGLDSKDAFRLLRYGAMPVADFAAEWFENELLRATVAARGIFGSFAGPWSPGTANGLLMQAAFGGDPLLMGDGIGGLAQVLAKAASVAGAQIRTNANVTHIRVKNGEVASIVLETGDEIHTATVISSADPQRTFLRLMDATDLDPGFLSKVRAYRTMGTVAKVNLALSGLPAFSGLKNGSQDLAGRIHIGTDIDYLEHAFDAAKYGDWSAQPYLDISVPSVMDASLAPSGSHVMSIHVQFAPYRLRNGNWNSRRDEFGDTVIRTLALYAPKIRDLIVHRQVITPLDLEEKYGLSGGHIFHGEHAMDQLFASRPFLGCARYRTPIKGLYLCGAGTHPGGGITGAPGANASREIIKDLKSRR